MISSDYTLPSTQYMQTLTDREQQFLAGFLVAAEIYAKDYSIYNTPLMVAKRYIETMRKLQSDDTASNVSK